MNKTSRNSSSHANGARTSRPRGDPYRRYGVGFLVLAALVFLLVAWIGIIANLLISWLIAISVTAFVAYGFDKLSARSHWLRVPESVLIGLAFIGGTLGALLAMTLLHHKTSKRSFQWRFGLAVALQVALIGGYVLLTSRI